MKNIIILLKTVFVRAHMRTGIAVRQYWRRPPTR